MQTTTDTEQKDRPPFFLARSTAQDSQLGEHRAFARVNYVFGVLIEPEGSITALAIDPAQLGAAQNVLEKGASVGVFVALENGIKVVVLNDGGQQIQDKQLQAVVAKLENLKGVANQPAKQGHFAMNFKGAQAMLIKPDESSVNLTAATNGIKVVGLCPTTNEVYGMRGNQLFRFKQDGNQDIVNERSWQLVYTGTAEILHVSQPIATDGQKTMMVLDYKGDTSHILTVDGAGNPTAELLFNNSGYETIGVVIGDDDVDQLATQKISEDGKITAYLLPPASCHDRMASYMAAAVAQHKFRKGAITA